MTRFILLLTISVSMLLIAPYVGYSAKVNVKRNKPNFGDIRDAMKERGGRGSFEKGELKERRKENRGEEEERGGNFREKRNEMQERREEEE